MTTQKIFIYLLLEICILDPEIFQRYHSCVYVGMRLNSYMTINIFIVEQDPYTPIGFLNAV